MTESQPAPKPSPKPHRRHTAPCGSHSARLDREIDQLRRHLQDSSLLPGASPALTDVAAILGNISCALLEITRLFHTYQILQSAGEPLAEYLEQSLTSLVHDLEAYDRPQVMSRQP